MSWYGDGLGANGTQIVNEVFTLFSEVLVTSYIHSKQNTTHIDDGSVGRINILLVGWVGSGLLASVVGWDGLGQDC